MRWCMALRTGCWRQSACLVRSLGSRVSCQSGEILSNRGHVGGKNGQNWCIWLRQWSTCQDEALSLKEKNSDELAAKEFPSAVTSVQWNQYTKADFFDIEHQSCSQLNHDWSWKSPTSQLYHTLLAWNFWSLESSMQNNYNFLFDHHTRHWTREALTIWEC